MTKIPAVLVSLALLSACSGESDLQTRDLPAADKVFVNAAVYTVDAERSWAEAVAISGSEIVYVGSSEEARALIGPDTDVVDLGGQMLLPGFHDSHIHILTGVMDEDECSILRIETAAKVAEQLSKCTALAGIGDERWVIGGGWGEWLWPEANPQKGILDILFPDRPVYLESSFGHAAWVNSKALQLAGVDDETENPAAGIIERDPETGEASGTLRDAAMLLVKNHLPPLALEQRMQRVRAGVALAHSFGITSLIEPGVDQEILEPIIALADQGEMSMRAVTSLSPINWQPGIFDDGVYAFLEQREQWRRPNLDVDSVKVYMDGVIEYGTSPLLEPYADADYGYGEFFYEQEKVNEYFTRFDAMGLQVHVHAIGDAAIRRALDGFEAMREANGMSDNRHHIVHLQLIHEDDVPRFGELNVTATFQSLWAYPDDAAMELDVPMLGKERTWQMYPIASVHNSGGRIAGGSDFWVTDLNPLQAIEVAVTRQDPYTNDGPILDADEAVDLATMIEAYTINGAYLMKLDDVQGSIEVGKRADLVVLDKNLFEISSHEINEAQVTLTVFDGRTVYQN